MWRQTSNVTTNKFRSDFTVDAISVRLAFQPRLVFIPFIDILLAANLQSPCIKS